MSNKAISTIKYTGMVTLSQYIGSKKIKIAQMQNTGGNPLFDFIADCLVGDFTLAKFNRPTKIMLLKRTAHETTGAATTYTYEGLTGFSYLTTKPEKVYDPTNGIVRYSFLIPSDWLEGIDNFDNVGIGLFTDSTTDRDLESYAAFCELTVTKTSLVNAALVVDWELIISNNK